MTASALVDAGPLVAIFGKNQPQATRYKTLLKNASDEQWTLATTWPCVVEASYLLAVPQRYTMLQWVAASGIDVFPFGQDALNQMIALMKKFTESPKTEMDLADASLVWLAIESGVNQIMTMDLRDFSRYRLPNGEGFRIL
jgi:uncharacterized protein